MDEKSSSVKRPRCDSQDDEILICNSGSPKDGRAEDWKTCQKKDSTDDSIDEVVECRFESPKFNRSRRVIRTYSKISPQVFYPEDEIARGFIKETRSLGTPSQIQLTINDTKDQPEVEVIDSSPSTPRASNSRQSLPVTPSTPKTPSSLPPKIIVTPKLTPRLTQTTSQQRYQSHPLDIDEQSIKSLQPGKELNDSVVEFFLNSLIDNNFQMMRDQIHIFSTFFYNKLKDLDLLKKEPSENLEKLVRRWDKNVKLFDKEYLVVPICDSKHWLLVIVCYANKLPPHDQLVIMRGHRSKEEPAILIFDSLGCRYMTKFTDRIRIFLESRWKFERPDQKGRKFRDREVFKDIFAKVPRQRNGYDCGIHLLNSFENFFSSPKRNYQNIRDGYDLTADWHVNTTAKRELIRNRMERVRALAK